ncbi:MAG: hypothetical protein AAB613_01545 [Patescibacteria group bacterium]
MNSETVPSTLACIVIVVLVTLAIIFWQIATAKTNQEIYSSDRFARMTVILISILTATLGWNIYREAGAIATGATLGAFLAIWTVISAYQVRVKRLGRPKPK